MHFLAACIGGVLPTRQTRNAMKIAKNYRKDYLFPDTYFSLGTCHKIVLV